MAPLEADALLLADLLAMLPDAADCGESCGREYGQEESLPSGLIVNLIGEKFEGGGEEAEAAEKALIALAENDRTGLGWIAASWLQKVGKPYEDETAAHIEAALASVPELGSGGEDMVDPRDILVPARATFH